MDTSPVDTFVEHFGYRNTQTAQELLDAVRAHLLPHAKPNYQRALQKARDQLIDANDRLAEAALTWGQVRDGDDSMGADSLRAHIEAQHHALATYLEAVAIVADDDDLKERAGITRVMKDAYVEAVEAVLDATVAGAETEAPAGATVH